MNKNEFSKVTMELFKKLKEIYDDRDFIIAILTYADNDEDRQIILDFINEGENVTDETLTLLAMELDDRHKNN